MCDWLLANRLTSNINKSKFVIFHPHQRKIGTDINLKVLYVSMHEHEILKQLEHKTYVKYLVVLIDKNLSQKYNRFHCA